jgi:hypothetical protein
MQLQVTVGAEVAVAPLAHQTIRCATGHCPVLHRTLSGATPDSSVNYSGVAPRIPEGEQFGVRVPGAPDSPVCQTRAHFG